MWRVREELGPGTVKLSPLMCRPCSRSDLDRGMWPRATARSTSSSRAVRARVERRRDHLRALDARWRGTWRFRPTSTERRRRHLMTRPFQFRGPESLEPQAFLRFEHRPVARRSTSWTSSRISALAWSRAHFGAAEAGPLRRACAWLYVGRHREHFAARLCLTAVSPKGSMKGSPRCCLRSRARRGCRTSDAECIEQERSYHGTSGSADFLSKWLPPVAFRAILSLRGIGLPPTRRLAHSALGAAV